jgi:carboxypeptidase C (cathepsin A)
MTSFRRAASALLMVLMPLALRAERDPVANSEPKPDDEPILSVTAHSITVDGKVLTYHATAGYMILKEEEGKPLVPPDAGAAPTGPTPTGDNKEEEKFKNGVKPTARVFFVAYTLDGVADPGQRPITYLFNGGPGSSSIWLHMGSVAPRRANLTPEGEAPPPPFQLVDNESTWLDRTDLVFIDPVSTGYSRTMPKEDPRQFHGLKEDIASVGDFIRLYTSRNGRWLSPKFVLGESYGTTRAAGLSDYLQSRYGLYLNGIILVSSVLNYQAVVFSAENPDPYIGYLPSYAATAWYHHKLSPEMQAKSVAEVAEEARVFAGNAYALALLHGDTVSAQDRQHIADELSRFTGIPASEFLLLKLRMKDVMFFDRLLRAEGLYLGRFDARFTGISYSPGETTDDEYDPSDEAVAPPMTAAFNDYVRRELKFESDLPYEKEIDVDPWNFGDASNGFPNTSEDLRKAMTRNPYLKVWVTCGYYDLATPFFAAENVVAGMNLDPSIRANLRFTYYESGHMLYIHAPSRAKFKADFLSFLNDATNQPVVHTAARAVRLSTP